MNFCNATHAGKERVSYDSSATISTNCIQKVTLVQALGLHSVETLPSGRVVM